MRPRGGEKHLLELRLDGTLEKASDIFNALGEATSPEGKRFNQERKKLHSKWRTVASLLAEHLDFSGQVRDEPRQLGALPDVRALSSILPQLISGNTPLAGTPLATADVPKYLSDIDGFCRKWSLEAWWAVPAIVLSHMLGDDEDGAAPLGRYDGGRQAQARHNIIVRIPGADVAEYLRLRSQVELGALKLKDGARHRTFPLLGGHADAVCVILAWNGRSRFGRFNATARDVTPSTLLIEECQRRLDRKLTKHEREEIRNEASPQISAARAALLQRGMRRVSRAKMDRALDWVVRKILNPSLTFEQIAAQDAVRSGEDVPPDAVRKACRQLAAQAQLEWPPRRTRTQPIVRGTAP